MYGQFRWFVCYVNSTIQMQISNWKFVWISSNWVKTKANVKLLVWRAALLAVWIASIYEKQNKIPDVLYVRVQSPSFFKMLNLISKRVLVLFSLNLHSFGSFTSLAFLDISSDLEGYWKCSVQSSVENCYSFCWCT